MAKLKNRTGTKEHKVVTREQWLTARKALLNKEKKFTRLGDQLSRQRRDLPWVEVDKEYVFNGPGGRETLAELFDGKCQLLVYHFMFGPGWKEGCPHCSFWADNFNPIVPHLHQRDTAFVAISRAPWKEIAPFKKRMGWSFKWVSSFGTDFNYDYYVSFSPKVVKSGAAFYNYSKQQVGVTEREGVSAFYKDETGAVFHTYSTYARGIDVLNTAYHYLDLTAKGRDEDPDNAQDWVDYRDKYRR
jgi:predicted dithiol-disulfide oxidoreductase (DUF899 family)